MIGGFILQNSKKNNANGVFRHSAASGLSCSFKLLLTIKNNILFSCLYTKFLFFVPYARYIFLINEIKFLIHFAYETKISYLILRIQIARNRAKATTRTTKMINFKYSLFCKNLFIRTQG